MRALLINNDIRQQIADLVTHAEKNPFTINELLDLYNGQAPTPGDMEEFTLNIPVGYRIVFSIDQYSDYKVRHLSVSVDTPTKLPSIPAVDEILKLIGFENELENCIIKLEEFAPGHFAINLLEKIN